MKSFIAFILSFLLIACTGEKTPDIPAPIESIAPSPLPEPKPTPTPTTRPEDYSYQGPIELQPYINTFVNLGKVHGVTLDVSEITLQFGSLSQYGSGVIGLCEMGYGDPLITLNESWWKKSDNIQRTLLVVHELGHCDLKRPHRNDTSLGKPLSIMYPIILPNSTYLGNKENYDHELYTYPPELRDGTPSIFVCGEDEL